MTGEINMNNKHLFIAALLAAPMSAQADALFGNDMAGDAKLPRTWGIGIDYFEMDQPYELESLSFSPPVLPIADPSILPINNDIRHNDLKIDVWVLPFLNVFGIYGRIDGETHIDLGVLGIPLPPATSSLTVDYDGDVFGGGVTLAVGGERWFTSLTHTMTDTDLGGDFNSSVDAATTQLRLGARFGDHTEFWVGGYWIDAEESHNGTIPLDLGPFIPLPPGLTSPVDLDFAVDLSQAEDFNMSFGTHLMLSDAWEATVEVGVGDRSTVLGNITYRFE